MSGTGAGLPLQLERRIEAFALRRTSLGRSTVAFREAGRKGPTVVLLHGISSGSASWLQQLEALSSHCHVVAWDAPGYGGSTPLPMETPRAQDYAEVLRGLIGVLPGPVHLVGHSLGALIAAAYARRASEGLASVSLLNPALGYGAAAPGLRAEKLAMRLEQMGRLGPAGFAEARAPELVSRRASAEAVELLRWNARRLDVTGYAQAARMLAGADLLQDVAGLALPLLVLTGSEDRITPAGSAESVARACPAARFVTLPGVGHASYVEAPAEVQAELMDFIEARSGVAREAAGWEA